MIRIFLLCKEKVLSLVVCWICQSCKKTKKNTFRYYGTIKAETYEL